MTKKIVLAMVLVAAVAGCAQVGERFGALDDAAVIKAVV